MSFCFDEEIPRDGTHSLKWSFRMQGPRLIYSESEQALAESEQLLPLWVADMDFRCAPAIIEAMQKRVAHGIYGYSAATPGYYSTITEWMQRRHHWDIDPDWIVITPGVVPALNLLVQTLLQPGEKVLVQRPVYYPFFSAVRNNGAELVSSSLLNVAGDYRMDFADLQRKTADPAVKLAFLCNPHNPVGRVWTRQELLRFGEICHANQVRVVADEIHADLTHEGYRFTPFASLGPDFQQHSITCTAASKSFNLAGLTTSNIIIADSQVRERFTATLHRNGLLGANTFGLVATEAAYTHGEPWLDAALAYIGGNAVHLRSWLAQHLPGVGMSPLQGTYLAWVDCNALPGSAEDRHRKIFEQARVYLDDGLLFGPEGRGFERFNLACPRGTLDRALQRLVTVLQPHGD